MSEAYTNEVSVAHRSFVWWFHEVPVLPTATLLSPVFDIRRGYPPDQSLLPGQQTGVLPSLPVGEVWELTLFVSVVGLAIPTFGMFAGTDPATLKLSRFFAATGVLPGVRGATAIGPLLGQFCQFSLVNTDLVLTSDFSGACRVRPA